MVFMSIGHLYVLFGKVSIQVLRLFFNWVVCFYGVLCTYFVNFALPDVSANIFSHSVGCLFILLMISFVVQKLFSLM